MLKGSLLGAAAIPLAAQQALAATAFTSFAFTATGEPGARTMPDRLAETKNVRDFGAVGNGSTPDTTAIQNAVNAVISAGGGTVYFPAGNYLIASPITFNAANLSICFRGDGEASALSATFATPNTGYILDRSLGSPNNTGFVVIEKLLIQDHGGLKGNGAIRIGSCIGAQIRDIGQISGYTCITTEDSPGNSSQNVFIQSVNFNSVAGPGCGGLVMGGSGSVQGCHFISCDTSLPACTAMAGTWAAIVWRIIIPVT